jgi:hypothetical protein
MLLVVFLVMLLVSFMPATALALFAFLALLRDRGLVLVVLGSLPGLLSLEHGESLSYDLMPFWIL